MNKSHSSNSSYSQWRKGTKIRDSFCLENGFIEYINFENKQIPYVIMEVSEPMIDLDNFDWHKSILGFKKHQAEFLRSFSKQNHLPWLIVMFKVVQNIPVFKVYNDQKTYETLYTESEFVKILEEYKQKALNFHQNNKNHLTKI